MKKRNQIYRKNSHCQTTICQPIRNMEKYKQISKKVLHLLGSCVILGW